MIAPISPTSSATCTVNNQITRAKQLPNEMLHEIFPYLSDYPDSWKDQISFAKSSKELYQVALDNIAKQWEKIFMGIPLPRSLLLQKSLLKTLKVYRELCNRIGENSGGTEKEEKIKKALMLLKTLVDRKPSDQTVTLDKFITDLVNAEVISNNQKEKVKITHNIRKWLEVPKNFLFYVCFSSLVEIEKIPSLLQDTLFNARPEDALLMLNWDIDLDFNKQVGRTSPPVFAIQQGRYKALTSSGNASSASYYFKVAALLLKKRAEANVKWQDDFKETLQVTCESIRHCHVAEVKSIILVIEQLLRLRLPFLQETDELGHTPLYSLFAALSDLKAPEKIREVLTANIQWPGGDTLLHLAIKAGYFSAQLIGTLIENGAEVNAENDAGETALDLAQAARANKAQKALAERGGICSNKQSGARLRLQEIPQTVPQMFIGIPLQWMIQFIQKLRDTLTAAPR